ncbi:uncharacterized protein LOC119111659 [Pollicipes pollicipes]|uniref:uncharacterized protein LOC119111659 n=1 Tax=Pollicipes pollicipes TaxID=41117 RepID=UPI0018857C7C|nr:uncharacterized protein LOC119111659 [Pollicipes pollicipes]
MHHGGATQSRQKRFLAYNFDEKRLTLPPGTILFLTPTLNVPFIRDLAKGYQSKLTLSAPFQIAFDDLDFTDEFNPWGIVPGLSIPQKEEKRRSGQRKRMKRTIDDFTPHPLGDRVTLFQVVEEYLMNLGHNGRACLLRAICEINQQPLPYHGLLGEFLQMIFRRNNIMDSAHGRQKTEAAPGQPAFNIP